MEARLVEAVAEAAPEQTQVAVVTAEVAVTVLATFGVSDAISTT